MNLNFMSLPQPTFNVVYSSVNLPQLQSPYLICGFPGTGYVGKIAIDHLIQELNAKHLADIYSTSFPAQIMIRTGHSGAYEEYYFLFKGCGFF
jgi:proteasome assembly chaperone (PAC2) family protein